MNHLKKVLVVVSLIFISHQSFGQSFGGTNLAFRGMSGYLGFGVADFSVINPESNFRMDDGTFIYLGGEKQIGLTGLFITISINYMESSGASFYDYTTLGGVNYTNQGVTPQIDFDSTHLQLGLGLKFKIFPTSWFRPYGEGGGLFGYHTIKHNIGSADLNNNDGGAKTEDGLTGFGYYLEAGLEIDFSELWGIRVGARHSITETREFETLANQKVKYEAQTFHFAIGRKF